MAGGGGESPLWRLGHAMQQTAGPLLPTHKQIIQRTTFHRGHTHFTLLLPCITCLKAAYQVAVAPLMGLPENKCQRDTELYSYR
jgi:hypothetical protein